MTDRISREVLDSASRTSLIVGDKKHRGYNIFIANDTILDRTRTLKFTIEDKEFSSIAHYLMYAKCVYFRLAPEIVDDIYSHYKVVFPLSATVDRLPYEDSMLEKYSDAFSAVSGYLKTEWKEKCCKIAAECIVDVANQNKTFATALKDTKNTIIVETSASILWGTDSSSVIPSDLGHPEVWGGENYYGQALTAARDSGKINTTKLKELLSRKIF